MSLFSTNIARLALQMLPVPLRAGGLRVWVDAMAVPFVPQMAALAGRRVMDWYDLSHTSQVCKMEAVLNDVFDPLQRRIYIQDAPDLEPLWIYRRAEQKPVAVFRRQEDQPRFIYRRTETSGGLQFVVCVPVGLPFDMAHLRALVNKYRIPSSSYSVKIV